MFDFIKKPSHNFSTYDMLFGDLPLAYWASIGSKEIPWNLFKTAKKCVDAKDKKRGIEILNEIIEIPGLESRQYLQAYHFLNELESAPGRTLKVFGVVVEINMPQGNDVLAVYTDRSARYYNFSGKSVIWEHPDNSMDALIDGIFEMAIDVVAQVGPWKDIRPKPPTNKMARINFLTSDGLYFGEASQQVLFNDPLAGRIMHQMLSLMNTLIDKSLHAGSPGNKA